jgi:nitrate/nitrite-specific signal transduction histidine kinase
LAANLEVGFENNPARNLRPRLTQPLINFTTAIGVLTADLNLLRDPSVKADPAAYAAKASSNLALSFQLWDQVVTELDILLDQRIRGYVRRRQMVIVGVAIVLAIVTYLFIGFYLAVMQTVSSLDRAAKQMTTGDVTQPITLDNWGKLSIRLTRWQPPWCKQTKQ